MKLDFKTISYIIGITYLTLRCANILRNETIKRKDAIRIIIYVFTITSFLFVLVARFIIKK